MLKYGSSTVAIRVCRNNALHHVDECGLLPLAQISSVARCAARADASIFARSAVPDGVNLQSRARRSSSSDGPFDKIAGGQPLERAGRRRPVQRDIGRQCGLIGGFADRERGKQAVLQRRDLEFAARLLE